MNVTVSDYLCFSEKSISIEDAKKLEDVCLKYCEENEIPYGGEKIIWDIGFQFTFPVWVIKAKLKHVPKSIFY